MVPQRDELLARLGVGGCGVRSSGGEEKREKIPVKSLGKEKKRGSRRQQLAYEYTQPIQMPSPVFFPSLIPCLFFPSLWCSYADNQVRRVVIVTRGAVLGLDGQIGQTRRKSDRSLSSGGGGTARMQNTETRFDSTHLWLRRNFCCTTPRLYERDLLFPFSFYSVLPSLPLFLSLLPSYILFM